MNFLKRLCKKCKQLFTGKAPEESTPEKPAEKTEEKTNEQSTQQQSLNYHVTLDKDEDSDHYKMWRVRKERSNKTMQFFKTQAEAVDYAKNLADESGASVVIHKADGTIREQISKKNS